MGWQQVGGSQQYEISTSNIGSVAFVLNNEVYVGLGSDDVEIKDDFYKWDGSKWAAASNMKFPQARYGSVAFVLNNEVYVGLGSDDGDKNKDDFYKWDGSAWKEQHDMVYPKSVTGCVGFTLTR